MNRILRIANQQMAFSMAKTAFTRMNTEYKYQKNASISIKSLENTSSLTQAMIIIFKHLQYFLNNSFQGIQIISVQLLPLFLLGIILRILCLMFLTIEVDIQQTKTHQRASTHSHYQRSSKSSRSSMKIMTLSSEIKSN